MAMTLLPRFFVMRATSQGPYLGVQENPPPIRPSGFLVFDEKQIWSPRVKFAVEQSETGDGTLVHIRSCYNNKYWVAHDILRQVWIGASADKPLEDQTDPACTLFRASPSTISGTPGFQLLSIGRSMHVLRDESIPGGLTLSPFPGSTIPTVDWENRYYNYHRFKSGLDIGDPLVAHELFPTPDGNYRIKNLHFGKFWRRSPNWIWADAQDNNNSNDTLFSFVKISDGVIALHNLGNNNFCGGLTTEGKTNCLNAQYPTMSRQTRLMVEERVLQRDISDVRYRLSDSRIYQEEIQEVSHAFATNDSSDKENTVTLTYSTSDSRTTTWTNSVSVTLGVSVTFKTTIIPVIKKGEVQASIEFGYTHEWGVTETIEHTREASYAVVVPPLTTMKVTLMCTRAVCDVPFSYTQRDLLTNGERVTTIKDDGIFTGINSYNFYFQSSKVVEDDQGRIYE
ncbi:hypothetical protein L1987_10523 [Smallanthus sonchifolius]|uniref:Uncharacterized protein n=1 Tax=Smallanthus sonchifolius TaxID=185202 RepID=A0ACB9JSC5_9ASTR|nr:hypothetical protein L1987_10523 [Smallanthus sonchifolius]